jgi:hypothetical protein
MGDGVKFLIDLDSRVQGATAADTALGRIEQSAERANQAVKHSGHEFSALSSDLFKATVAAHLFEKGLEKATGFAIEGLHNVGALIKDTVNIAGSERRGKMAMTNLLGGEEEAEKALHYLSRFSELTEFGADKAQAMGTELLNSGYKGQQWQNALAAIADAASMSTDKLAGAQDALASLMTMKETGRLDARILRGLHLNVKDVVKGLGDALGMSPKAVKKALTDGAIPAAKAYEIVLQALEKKTGHALGEAGLKAGQGLDAKLTRLRELPEKIMKSVADSPGMEKIEHAFDRLLEAFDPEGPKGAKMVQGLERLMGSVGDFIEETDWDEVALKVGTVATSIGTWIDPLSKALALIEKVTEKLLALPTFGEDVGNIAGDVRLNLQRNAFESKMASKEGGVKAVFTDVGANSRETTFARDVRAKEQARLESENAAAWRDVDAAMGRGGGHAGKGEGGTHIEGKADVTVHVHGSNATPEAIGHAAKKGVEAGMTTALEQQALQSGTRSGRRRH